MKTPFVALKLTPYILAQTSGGSSSLTQGLGKALSIIMLIAFMIGVVMIIGGSIGAARGNAESGKMAIVWGVRSRGISCHHDRVILGIRTSDRPGDSILAPG